MSNKKTKWELYLKERYDIAKATFEVEFEKADTVEEQLHAYARYAGKLEALIEGVM